jgi:hypothetical protein
MEEIETAQTEGMVATPVKVRRKRLRLRLLKSMKVAVGQSEIDHAIRANSRKCMIHQSIERDYPSLKNIVVDKNQVRVTDPDRDVIYTFDMAPLAKAAILKWDAGETIQPFEFRLRHPIVRQRIKRNDGRKGTSNDRAARSLGVVPTPKTPVSRAMAGRDRVFGAKLWETELTKLRVLIGVSPAA